MERERRNLLSVIFETYFVHLFAIYRVGRQGTLLCKEINIGYL